MRLENIENTLLKDGFGREFHYLRLSVTDVCNFRCNYCLPNGYISDTKKSFLSLDEIATTVKAFANLGTSKIRITGGEPALRKDLIDIIRICATTQGIEKVALTTNGYRLEKAIDAWANAGLTSINISIDSLDPNMFGCITGHDKLESIMRGIERALALGLKVKVNTVLLRQYNHNDLARFLEWIKSKAITLRFIELMETGDNKKFFKLNHSSGEPIKQDLLDNGWLRVVKDKSAGPAEEFWHPDYQGQIGLIMPYSNDFCSSCNRLRISSTGKLHLCLFADMGIDLRPYMQSDDPTELQQALVANLTDKEATHYLHQGSTGATSHLAMLGG